MSRVIRGTKDLKNRIVMKSPQGGTGRIRCPKCQGLAVPATDNATGQPVLQCSGCGTKFSSKPM